MIFQKFKLKLDIFVVVDFHVFLAVDAHVFGVAEGDVVGAFGCRSVVDGLVVMFLIDAEIGLFGLFFGLGFVFAVDNGCDCVFVAIRVSLSSVPTLSVTCLLSSSIA